MSFTVHGTPGTIVFLLALLGALHILSGIGNWLAERISIDLHPLWHVIPRRFRVSVRWDRPGAYVTLADGCEAVILSVYECDDQPCPVALVQPCSEYGDLGPAEWLPVTALLPLPGHSFRETLRAVAAGEDENA